MFQVCILRNFDVLLDAQQNVRIIIATRALQQLSLLPIRRLIPLEDVLTSHQTFRRPRSRTTSIPNFLALNTPVKPLFIAMPTSHGQVAPVCRDCACILALGRHPQRTAETSGPVDSTLDGTQCPVDAVPEGCQRGGAIAPEIVQFPAFGVGIAG